MRLSLKIQLPIVALIMLIMGASSFFYYRQSSTALEAALVNTMRGEADALTRSLGVMVGGVLEAAERIIELDGVLGFYEKHLAGEKGGGELFSAKLKQVVGTYKDFDRVALLSSAGIVLASTAVESIGQDYSDRDYFKTAIQGKSVVSQPLLSRVSGKGAILAVAPVRVAGRIAGVLYCSIPLERFFETTVRPVTIGRSGYAFVLAQNGHIAMHRNADYLFKDLPTTPQYKKMISGEQGSGVMEYVGVNGDLVYNYYMKETVSGLVVVTQAESSDVFADLARMRSTALIICVVSVIVGAVLLFFLLRPVELALNARIAFAGRVAAGDLSGTLSINRKDELGRLADALRAIPTSLKRIILEYQTLEKRITHGELDVEADAGTFAGEFSLLVEGTNAILRRFRRIVDFIPSPVIVLDQDLKAAFINEAARELTGDDFKGKTCKELMNNDDADSPASALKLAATENRRVSAETRAHPRGRDMDVAYSVIPMPDNAGKTASFLELYTDITEIKTAQRTMSNVAGQASSVSDRVTKASEELSDQVAQVSRGAETQRSRVENTASAMTEMNSAALEVARNAGQASEQSERTKNKAEEGAELVNQVVEAINSVNRVAEALQASMRELGGKAENIGGVMNVISDIADQTNLLALNAAIEAARAGEAGRGFAVVADEVRKLAEKTMNATREVGGNITAIQQSVKTNMREAGEAVTAVAEATRLAGTSGQALTEIVDLATSNSVLVTSIAGAAEEQRATSEEINVSVDEINRIAGETSQGMEQASGAVQELSRMARELGGIMEELK